MGHPIPERTGCPKAEPENLEENSRHFWQARYYDFNVWTARKRVKKLRYIHRNPVKRGLVEKPEDWRWSSFRNYATGEEGVVEIESPWTGRKRERAGTAPRVKIMTPTSCVE